MMDMLNRWLDQARAARAEMDRRPRITMNGDGGGPGWGGTAMLAALSAAAGAAAAFLLDPARGKSRRARLVDQSGAVVRRAGRQSQRLMNRVRSDVEGRVNAVREGDGHGAMDDATVADRVQTELFRDPEVPKSTINVNVEAGIVVLRGEVPNDDMRKRLVSETEKIDGVWSVRDLLHLPGEPAATEAPIPSR